jgi:hypothetical protein
MGADLLRRKGYGQGLPALAIALMMVGATACAAPARNTDAPSPRSTYRSLVTVAPSRHITYPEQLPPGGCLLGGTPPDQNPLWLCVPGVITSGINESNYPRTGCDPAYVRRIRPPASEIKEAMHLVGKEFRLGPAARWQLDWLVPLSLGGANDLKNLWPITTPETASRKGKVDEDVLRAVCNGTVSLTAAQTAMAADWTYAELSLGIKGP